MTPMDPTRLRRATRLGRTVSALGALGLATTTAVAPADTPGTPAVPAATPASSAAPSGSAAAAPRSSSRVALAQRRLNVRVGATAWIRGRVHAHDPQLVRLQRRTPGGRWKTLAQARPDGKGRFELRHRADEAASQRLRVRYSGDERNRAATKSAGRLNTFRMVQASWYGPGLYGGRTACGQTFSAGVMGVAHKSLPCGTRLTLRKGTRTVRVSVIDRGPFVAGREFDLSPAVKNALGFGSTGAVGATV